MRSIPEEALKRRQSDKRKDTMQRLSMWFILVISACLTGKEFLKSMF